MPLRVRPQTCIVLCLSKREIWKVLECTLSFLGLGDLHLDLEITDDKGIELLNQNYLGCVGPTNVLSFPDDSNEGYIVISIDAVEREALLYAQPVQEHFVRLLSHGILHLAGYDHGEIMGELTEQAVENFIDQFS